MTKGNVLRVMESKDLCYFPEIREMFDEYGHHGSYFFFVIKDYEKEGDEEHIVGYLIAKQEGKKAIIKDLKLFDTVENKQLYHNTAFSNLFDYVQKIKGSGGERKFFQVSSHIV